MGATPSKDELLYYEVQNGNHDAVKSLRRDGASLEWVDKEGRTPLLLACSRSELLDMTITLLNLGANTKAYCSGTHGGYPLHHAAKRGLDKTVTLLISRGANPLAVNDGGQTPLEMARSRGHVAVVRLLEEKLCIFSGTLRELSGFGILESLAPNLVTKKVWAVVLPRKSHSRRTPDYELAIYEPPKLSLWNGVRTSSAHPAGLCNVAQPRTVIALAKVEMEAPDFSLADSVLCITDKIHKTKYKLFSENKADKEQLKSLYRACRAVSQDHAGTACANGHGPTSREDNAQGCEQESLSQIQPINVRPSQCKLSSRMQPVLQSVSAPSLGRFTPVTSNKSMAESMSEDLAFALALNESIRTATAEGIPVSPDASIAFRPNKYAEWAAPDIICNGWSHQDQWQTKASAYKAMSSASQRWASASILSSSLEEVPSPSPPSAPPLSDKATHHSCIETDTNSGGTCVVCWDAPAEGACIPCGHLAGCMNCLTKVQSKRWGCPVCRGIIEQVIKVYAV
eukprot:c22879_g1_i1 orf=338-1873(-)